MNKEIMYMRCATNLHMGAENEIGFVDMPIQREKHTGIPKMESSGIKGVLSREVKSELLFGKGSEEGGEASAGNLRIYDGRVLFFPVQSNSSAFVYITCPFVLQRFWSETEAKTEAKIEAKTEAKIEAETEAKTKTEKVKLDLSKVNDRVAGVYKGGDDIALGEFSFKTTEIELGNLEKVKNGFVDYLENKKLVVVSDDVFSYFMEMGTVVRTRNKIKNETGVAENLFTVEYLPEETILYSVLEYKKENEEEFEKLKCHLEKVKYVQFGGEESLGKGITQIHIGGIEDENSCAE